MSSIVSWIWNRPLDPVKDTDVWISRADEVGKLLEILEGNQKAVFLWSPPKCGTTTFFNELAGWLKEHNTWSMRLLKSKEVHRKKPSLNSRETVKGRMLFVMDELEELPDAGNAETVIKRAAELMSERDSLVLAGDSRALRFARESELLGDIRELQLQPMTGEDAAKRLVIAPLGSHGYHLSMGAAMLLCREAAGNPYLIQRLAEAFFRSIRGRSGTEFGAADMEAFLANALHQVKEVKDYFDDLADRILRDSKAPYAIIDMLEGELSRESDPLRGLGIASPDGRSFASRMFEKAFRERCTPLRLAQRFGAMRNWVQAVEFYEFHLARWRGTQRERIEALLEVLNACFAARNSSKYTSFACQLSQIMPAGERTGWLRDTFIPRVSRLLAPLSEKDSDRIFEAVVQAVDAVTRTGRVRFYLADASGERLLCRAALGVNAEEFRRQPVTIGTRDWKVSDVYLSGAFADVEDAHRDDNCNREIARRLQIYSAWLFPVFAPGVSNGSGDIEKQSIGVLCVDNPYHSPDQPGSEERTLVDDLMLQVAEPLMKAKVEADRSDLQFRIERLISLHEHILTDHPSEQILEHLFEVATDIQPDLSVIVVRSLQGYHLDRLGVEGYWPGELQSVFARPELNRINVRESIAKPEDMRPVRFFPNVHEIEGGMPTALSRFMNALDEDRIYLPLGSLLSFRLEEAGKYMGMFNFYTRTPRELLEGEKEALAMIVKQAAVALYNAKRIAEMNRQRQGLQILSDCITLVNDATATPSDLIREMTRRLGELFGVYSATFVAADYDQHELRVEYTWPEEEAVGGPDMTLKWGDGVTGRAIEDRLLFSMGLEFQEDLDDGELSERLRQQFENNNIQLSQNVTIQVEEEHSKWVVDDGDRNVRYIIKKEDDILNTYEDRKSCVLSIKDDDWDIYVERVPDIKCSAAIPMVSVDEQKVIGALALEAKDEDVFTPDDIQLIEAIISQAPVAMTNADLVSDLRETNEELQRANRELEEAHRELEEKRWTEAMGESAAAAVHRMANIVGNIPAWSRNVRKRAGSVILTYLEDGENIMKNLEEIEKTGNHMLYIARRLSSGAKLNPKKVEAVSLLDYAKRISTRNKHSKEVEWCFVGSEDLQIMTEPEKLDEILECLIDNAVRASINAREADDGRTTTVTVKIDSIEDGWAVVDVTDSGRGVPLNVVNDLCRTIVNSNWHGNGIGLFVSNRFAAALGGKISLHKNSNSGATFRLRLPFRSPLH